MAPADVAGRATGFRCEGGGIGRRRSLVGAGAAMGRAAGGPGVAGPAAGARFTELGRPTGMRIDVGAAGRAAGGGTAGEDGGGAWGVAAGMWPVDAGGCSTGRATCTRRTDWALGEICGRTTPGGGR